MRIVLKTALRSRAMLTLACACVVALVYSELAGELWQVVTLAGVHQSSDSHTHLLRALMARDYFLPSGHHWGWDPFWFQGYVPFLLYPHLTYVGLALFSAAFEPNMARTLNVFSVAVLLALPLIGGRLLVRDGRAAAALLAAAWLASLSSDYGGGPQGMFHYGLLTQQVGLCMFVPFAHALVSRFDVRRAGLWLGVIGLTHQHTFLVAGIVWAITGASLAVLPRRALADDFREWIVATALALTIAAPTLLGLWHGLENRGAFTGFIQPPLYGQLMAGLLVAPWPTLVAVAVAVFGSLLGLRTAAEAGRTAVTIAVGVVLTALSLQFVTTGVDALDPMLRYVLRLRTLGYAACWWMVLGAVRFASVPRALRWGAIALTAAGIVVGWEHHGALAQRMRQAHAGGRPFQPASARAYAALLGDVRRDRGTETVTIALVVNPKPAFRHPFQRLTHVVRQPALGGHGVELSAVRNVDLVYRVTALPCPQVRRQVQAHAVGYLVGHNERALRHVSACLGNERILRRRDWWAVRTGVGWHNFDPRVRAFTHDATWTSLRWRLRPSPHPGRVRLPMAATAPWRATTDVGPAAVVRGADRMLAVAVPADASEVTLEYAGFAGEWASVGVGLAALLIAAGRTRRARSARRVGPLGAGLGAPAEEHACKPARARVL